MKPGNTPLVSIDGIFAKLECTNPTGSIKDRIASYIIFKSEENGLLNNDMEIIEATSGNTGIALSYFGREKGYQVTIVMPENMSKERKEIIRSLGANLILCSEEGSFIEAAEIRDKISQERGYFNPDQFSNPLNVECHYQTTGQEILKQINEYGITNIDALVAGVGTGGTLIGVAKALKEKNPYLHVAAVEPMESSVMSGKKAGSHYIQGIGDGFIPAIAGDGNNGLHPLIDRVICISSEDAKFAATNLMNQHGFCVGISSGANYLAARKLKKEFENIVTIFPDGFSKYKSFGLEHSCGKCPYEKRRINVLKQ